MKSFLAKLLVGYVVCFTAISFASDHPSRASLRHIEAGGIGYNHGYTTLEGFFAPDPRSVSVMPFFDLRGHVFDNGELAANIGVGIRCAARNRAYGFNIYYDHRDTKKNNYNQIGLGLETLGERIDFRINGYIPVSTTKFTIKPKEFVGFAGNYMMLRNKYQFAMTGANAELGYHFGKSRLFDFYAAAGSYYFTEKHGPHIWGGKVRLMGRFKEYVTVGLSNSYDPMFKNRFQGQIILTLPFGGDSSSDCEKTCVSDTISSRMVQPVERQEIVVLGCNSCTYPAINPATGLPFYFVFVDNTSNSRGTFESPYPTLAQAQQNSKTGDIIYVFPGDGTTKGMDTGIVLKFDQKFWGSGVQHALTTAQGTFAIPALSSSAPQITNIDGDGITLAPVNQVSGFTLTNVFGNGINGTGLETIDISDCTLDNSQLDQIHLEFGASAGTATLNHLMITNGDVYGMFINSTAAPVPCAVSVMNTVVEGNANGSIFNFAGPSTLVVTGNEFINNTSVSSSPIIVVAGQDALSVTVENNIIAGNVCGAVQFNINDTDSASLNISNNTFSNNGTGSVGNFGAPIFINPNSTASGNCQLNLAHNIFSNNVGSALYCFNGSFNGLQVNVTNNTMNDNGGAGIVIGTAAQTFSLVATNNTISNGGDHGITTIGSIILGEANMTISNNSITGNSGGASGIALSHESTDLNLVITGNTIGQNGTSGIVMYSSNLFQNLNVDIANNTISGNQNSDANAASGIDIEQYGNLSGSVVNNILFNNTGDDVYVGSTDSSPYACLTLVGNNSSTGYILSSGTGTFNLAPCDADSVNVGTIVPVGTITPVQSCPAAGACPP